MRHAETVTFGGSGLDRAAELRGTPEEIAAAPRDVVLLWRGKPLVEGPGLDRLVRLPVDHPVLSQADPEAVLLGRQEDGRLIEARELVDWDPEDVDPAQMNSFVDVTEQRHPLMRETEVFAELRRVMTRLSPRDAELAATAKGVLHWHVSHRFCARCGARSALAQAGWQRLCPSCGAHHFPRTDPVVIMLITHGNSVLMGRSPHWPEGMFSLLAGFVEPGETMEAAVRREVREEAGVKVGAVEYLASQPWAFPASLMFGCRGVALSREITIDPVEIEQAMWVSREEMMQAFAGAHSVLSPARKGAIAQFLLRNWLADTL
ncbi:MULTISPECIES: NAD(+) diphosphatase [unclassified Roseovarius]|uniref:NAD(+) diphosphatase n=1 Tax=unclassified Roseovarius TaxID=2614913 RepID=UPI00273F0B20|nr:NAD(+) diphosphatase [Roseovarius sp. MMSF_3350]